MEQEQFNFRCAWDHPRLSVRLTNFSASNFVCLFLQFHVAIVFAVLRLLIITLFVFFFNFMWPLYLLSFGFWLSLCLSFSSISCGHCIGCPSASDYHFVCLFLQFRVAIVLAVLRLLIITLFVFFFNFMWPLYWLSFGFWLSLCLSFSSISCGHCICCPSASDYHFVCLFLQFRVAIVFAVLRLLIITLFVFFFNFVWPLYWLSFGFWLSLCLSFSSISCGHCIGCPSASDYHFVCFFLQFHVAIVLAVLRLLIITLFVFFFNFVWPLYLLSFGFWLSLCLSFSSISCGHCICCPSASDYHFGFLKVFWLVHEWLHDGC